MTCVLITPVCKRPGELRDFAINWAGETFNFWRPGAEYAIGARVRPTVAMGFEFQATVGGQSHGIKEPKWVTSGVVVDGSVTWAPVALSTTGLIKRIQTSIWTAEDVSIVLSGASIINTAGTQAALIKISGGADGQTWDVLNHVLFDDTTQLDAILRVTIEDEAD